MGYVCTSAKCRFLAGTTPPDDGLTQEAMALLRLIPRERGLVLLGAELRKVTGAWL